MDYCNTPDIGLLQVVYYLPCNGPLTKLRKQWYGMVNVDLYSAIITKVSNALASASQLQQYSTSSVGAYSCY